MCKLLSTSSPDKQCRGRGYHRACHLSPDICTEMQCYKTHWQVLWYGRWCQNAGPVAEGTSCDLGRKCVDGVCQRMTANCLYYRVNSGEAENL